MRKKIYGIMAMALILLMLGTNVQAEEIGSTNTTTVTDNAMPEKEITSSTTATETAITAEKILKIDDEHCTRA